MLLLVPVDFTVELNNQTTGMAVKIDNISTDNLLPAEVIATQLTSSEFLPECQFSRSAFPAQFAGTLELGNG